MADLMDNGEFWLPSEFLDADVLVGKENVNKNSPITGFGTNIGFPTDFPYEFDSYSSSSVLSSPVESVVGSTETESDEEDLVAGLTSQLTRSSLHERAQKFTSAPQNLEKPWVLSVSPQSTLSAVGSWSGNGSPNGPSQVPSPPATPLGGNDAWDLIYAAAGQVARLKMNCGEGPPKGRGLLASPRILTLSNTLHRRLFLFALFIRYEHARKDQMLKQQCSSIWGKPTREGLLLSQQSQIKQLVSENRGRLFGGGGFESNGGYIRPLGPAQSAWPPPLQVQRQNNQNQPPPPGHGGSGTRAVFLGGSGVKRECAGTGVFLPRRYGNPSESRKKPGCSNALLPARVIHALNKNLDAMAAQSQADFSAHARYSGAFIPEYDALMARRNALLTQQNRNLLLERAMNHELCLPQEWTY
ncbi:uncharacterized protein LOC130763910 [Actinidia eriantha]|uniref:uncharacterized protein LOC130763910 n=1 Tax=Actinidia eriantha TaxID=165200 RepID=UPI0025837EAA|nr:uncharacterized protein LOC130763910 [Actinidia eriantha]